MGMGTHRRPPAHHVTHTTLHSLLWHLHPDVLPGEHQPAQDRAVHGRPDPIPQFQREAEAAIRQPSSVACYQGRVRGTEARRREAPGRGRRGHKGDHPTPGPRGRPAQEGVRALAEDPGYQEAPDGGDRGKEEAVPQVGARSPEAARRGRAGWETEEAPHAVSLLVMTAPDNKADRSRNPEPPAPGARDQTLTAIMLMYQSKFPPNSAIVSSHCSKASLSIATTDYDENGNQTLHVVK